MEQYDGFMQNKLPVAGAHEHDKVKVYQLEHTKQILAEVNIDSGLGGEPIELLQLTDLHINRVDTRDAGDEEIMCTLAHRQAFTAYEVIVSIDRMLRLVPYTDQLVITGDILDFLSQGGIDTVRRMIFSRFPQGLYTTGMHDICKQVQTGVPEKMTAAQREAIVQDFWPNDMFYAAKDVKDKVIAIGMNNNDHYHSCEIELLKADIQRARKEHKIILIFEHEPISTLNPENKKTPTILKGWQDEWDLYGGCVIGGPAHTNETDAAVIALIRENADVIKGLFHGHYHDILYTEIPATYTDANGTVHKTAIPQYGASGCCYFGGVGVGTRIIVK